jgi:chromosome segregation ATPase
MNIFDPQISGSLSVSGSGQISGDLTVLGTLFATISGTAENAVSASHAAAYTLTSSFHAHTNSFNNFTASYSTGSFTGSFSGNGAGLSNIPASGVTGLNLSQISQGSATASISQANGLLINTNTEITGNLKVNNINVGTNSLVTVSVTDLGGKYYIDGVKNPPLTLVKGFTYRFLFPNIGAHPFRFSTTNDGSHNGGTIYSTGVTIGSTPDYIQIQVTDNTPTTLYYYCTAHPGMGNSISVVSDILNLEADRNIVYIDPARIATTGSNSLTGSQIVSGSLSVTGSVNITGSISLNGQPIGTGKLDETVFNSYTSSNDGRVSALEVSTGSLNVFTNSIEQFSGSIYGFTSSINEKVNSLELTTSSLNTFTGSANSRLNSLESASSSIRTDFNTYTSSNDSTNSTQNNRLTSLESASGSIRTDFNTYTSSNDSTNSTQNSRLNSLESASSSINSYTSSNTVNINAIHTATSSLNTFSSSVLGAVEITGSNLTVKGNLLVKGTTTQIDSTTVNIGDNIIQLNGTGTNNGGLVVQDPTGASTISGSLLWDSTLDYWKAGKLGSEERIILFDEYNTFSTSIDSRAISIQGSTASLNLYTASNNTRLGVIESTTSSLNTFTSSANSRFNSIEASTGSLNSYTSSTNNRLNTIEASTSSLNSYTSSNNTRLSVIESTTGSLNTFTSSVNNSLTAIHTATSSLNSYTSSTNTRLGIIETSTGSLNNFTSSANGRMSSLESASSSIRTDFNTYTSSNNTRLGVIESTTSSLNSYTSSNNTRLGVIESTTSSLNSYTSSNNTRLGVIESTTGSLNSYTSSTNTRLGVIESTTASLNSYTSSTNTRLGVIETSTSSLNTFTSSAISRLNSLESASSSIRTDFNSYTSSNNSTVSTQNNRLAAIETATSSLNTYTSSQNTINSSLNSTTASLNSYTSSNNTRLGVIESTTGSLNSYTSSTNGRLNAIETATSSLNSFTNSINTTIKNRLNAEGVISGSAQVSLASTTGYSTFSSSLATTDAGQDSRLSSLEGKTGSYATTGSNIFQGNQTITGSLFVSQNLIIGGSSSINFVSQSTLNIGTNLITVNAQNPSTRFGGLAVIDSGSSPQVSGSMLFDSVNNQWIFIHQNQSSITSSIILMGPQTFNNVGNEASPTVNRIIKSLNDEHLGDSNITDTGTKVSINSNTEITGTLVVTQNISSPNITAIQIATGSLNSFTSSVLSAIELTGSNLTVKGNLLVKGTTTNVNTTTLDVDNNLINLNGTGATFAGLRVKDTTAPSQISGSLLWDAVNDYWIAGQLGSEQRIVRETEFNNAVTRIGNVEVSTSSLNSYTSSTNTRLDAIESTTSSLNSYTSSTNTRLGVIETATSSLNTFTSSANSRLNSLESASSSIRTDFNSYTSSNNSTNTTQNSRLASLETTTGSLNTYTSSNTTNINAIHTATSSLNSYTSSTNTRLGVIETATSSLNSYTSSTNTRLGVIESTTSSLNSYTSSNTININAIHTATSSLNTFTSSAASRLTSLESTTSSLNSYTSSNTTNINAIHTATSSLNSYTSSTNTRLGVIESTTASLNTFTSSAAGRLNSLESTSGSLNSYTSSNTTNINAIHTATSSLNSFTSSASSRLNAIETATSSLNSYTSSNNTAISAINTATSSLNTFTSSFNSAFSLSGADVTVRGNFTVSGTTTTVNSTTVNIADNIIQLNGTGATNAGLVVRDATAANLTSGSLLWDTTNDKWIAGPLGAEDDVVLRTTSQTLTNKTISGASNTLSNIGNSSLTNSSISIAGNSISLGGSITAATILSGTGTVSGSAQLTSSFVQKAGDTMTGQLIIGSTGTGNAATLKVNNSSAATFNHSIEAFSANMTAGQTNIIVVGSAGSTKNSGYIGYNWAGAGSNSNYVSLGHWGADHLFRIYGDGTVYMGTVTTGVWNGTSIGTAYTDAKITSVAGTTNQVNVSASTGAVTFSLPQNIHTAATPTFAGLTSTGRVQIGGSDSRGVLTVQTGSTQTFTANTDPTDAGRFFVMQNTDTTNAAGQYSNITLQINPGGSIGSGRVLGDIRLVRNGLNGTSARFVFGAFRDDSTYKDYLTLDFGGATFSGSINGLSVSGGTITSGTWNGSSISTTYTAAKVTAVNAGTGISVDTTTGSVTVTNSGVTSITGTANQVTASASTGGVTLSLPQNIHTGASPTFGGLTVNGGATSATFRNTTASSNSNVCMGNDQTTNGAGIALLGSTFTASGQYRASGGYVYSNLAGGLTLHAEGANSLYLATNGVAAITINSSQTVAFGGNLTTPNTTSFGLQDVGGTAWFRPRDAANNLHIRTSSGGIYLDTNGTIYFRNVAGTVEGYIDSSNGGGRLMDTTLYANAAAMNQSVTTTATPTFGGLTVGNGVATGRSTYGIANANIVLTSSASDATGYCGIDFRSGNNYPSDGAQIYYENNSGGTSERAKLTIRVENDQEDFMEIRAGRIDINSNTVSGGGQATLVNFQSAGSTVAYVTSGGAIYARSGNLVKDFGNSTYATSFSNVSSVTVTHNLGSKDVMVMVYDSNDEMFWPSSIVTTNTNVVTITFAANRTGRVVVLR